MHSHKNAQTHTDMLVYFSTSIFLDTHTSPQLSFLRAQPTSHLSTHTFKQEYVISAKSTGCEIGRCLRATSIWTQSSRLGPGSPIIPQPTLTYQHTTHFVLCKTKLCDILAEFPLLRAPDWLFLNLFLSYSDRVPNEQHQLDLLIYLWGFHLLSLYTIHNTVCTF